MDRLFVVDTRQIVRGSIPFHALVRADPSALTREVMLVNVYDEAGQGLGTDTTVAGLTLGPDGRLLFGGVATGATVAALPVATAYTIASLNEDTLNRSRPSAAGGPPLDA